MHVVLANACAPIIPGKTARVFNALGAKLVQPSIKPVIHTSVTGLAPDWHNLIQHHGNDLEIAAMSVMPDIAEVAGALQAQAGCQLVRLSGAGPTCFARFADAATSEAAAADVRAKHPSWWIVATTLG
jgi:4-diphosphocytidyl-2-C-methyl-D-erythritol kinase